MYILCVRSHGSYPCRAISRRDRGGGGDYAGIYMVPIYTLLSPRLVAPTGYI